MVQDILNDATLYPLQVTNSFLEVEHPNYSYSPERSFYLEKDVQLLKMSEGLYCLNHALRHRQIYGGEILKSFFDDINSGREIDTNHPLCQAMLKEEFVVNDYLQISRVKIGLIKEEDLRGQLEKPSFRLLRVLLTDVCNLACSYCKVVQNVKEVKSTPTDGDRLDDVVKFFFANSEEQEPKIIHITGGEPTLFKDQVWKILASKKKYSRPNENVWMVMGTNATLITEDDAKILAAAGVKCIVSMDGPEAIHDTLRGNKGGRGSWKKVNEGIRRLKAAGVEVSISIVIGQHNVGKADSIIEWILDEYQPTGLGVNFMKAPTPEMQTFAYRIVPKEYAETMYAIHKKFRHRGVFLELPFRKIDPFVAQYYRFHDCGAAEGANLNVDSKGNIGPCKSFLVMNELAIDQLDASAYQKTIVNKWRERSPIYFSECDGCTARGMCGNGCAYEARFKDRNEMGVDGGACEYTQHFNHLILADLASMVVPSIVTANWWHVVKAEERQKIAGQVAARENTLSYSIGHPRFTRPPASLTPT
jgi:radical SAM protein with 4Fe4S-binding SPASM domain